MAQDSAYKKNFHFNKIYAEDPGKKPVEKELPSQALSCAGYTGMISAFLKKHPGNSGDDD